MVISFIMAMMNIVALFCWWNSQFDTCASVKKGTRETHSNSRKGGISVKANLDTAEGMSGMGALTCMDLRKLRCGDGIGLCQYVGASVRRHAICTHKTLEGLILVILGLCYYPESHSDRYTGSQPNFACCLMMGSVDLFLMNTQFNAGKCWVCGHCVIMLLPSSSCHLLGWHQPDI